MYKTSLCGIGVCQRVEAVLGSLTYSEPKVLQLSSKQLRHLSNREMKVRCQLALASFGALIILFAGCETVTEPGNWMRLGDSPVEVRMTGAGAELLNIGSSKLHVIGVCTYTNASVGGPGYIDKFQPGVFDLFLYPGVSVGINPGGDNATRIHTELASYEIVQ